MAADVLPANSTITGQPASSHYHQDILLLHHNASHQKNEDHDSVRTLHLATSDSFLEKQTSRDEYFSCPRLHQSIDFRAENNPQRIRPPEGIFQLARVLGTMDLRIRILSYCLEHCESMSIKGSTSKECCYLQQVHPERSEIFLINSFGPYLVEFR